jgi:ribosomal-protein-alanine N-acetyltransferase
MKLEYSTQRLLLKVLSPENSIAVLDFYTRNKDFFEPFEPDRMDTFYSESFQHANLVYEYNLFCQFKYLRLWLFHKDDPNTVIGTICFSNIVKGAFQTCMVGYKMDQNHCNKGYAKEALSYAVQLIFQEYGLHRIEAFVLPSNEPSIKLLKGIGFEYEGIAKKCIKLDGIWKDHLRYAMVDPL